MMRLYEISVVATLLLVVVLMLGARNPYEPRCPNCGERDGQVPLSKREISTRRFRFRIPWFARSPLRRQPSAAHQSFVEGTMKCSACSQTYERRWFEQVETF
jgi:hypothetical protein